MIREIDKSTGDLLINFMHPLGPAGSFHWPANRDLCWIPFQHILYAPVLLTSHGHYQLTSQSAENVEKAWLNFLPRQAKCYLTIDVISAFQFL